MVAVLLVRMGQTLARQYRERQDAIRQAERLKYELLRKTIQPHFLMNSLATAIGHVEEDPARGITVLRDLAQEMEAFFAVGERLLIPVSEEVELCRRHVATMSHLLDRRLSFEADPAPQGQMLPPGVLLTLIENALTHGRHVDRDQIRLAIRRDGDRLMYEVSNPMHAEKARGHDGTGLRYVRAQLENAYGSHWTMDQRRVGDRWFARIEVRENYSPSRLRTSL